MLKRLVLNDFDGEAINFDLLFSNVDLPKLKSLTLLRDRIDFLDLSGKIVAKYFEFSNRYKGMGFNLCLNSAFQFSLLLCRKARPLAYREISVLLSELS